MPECAIEFCAIYIHDEVYDTYDDHILINFHKKWKLEEADVREVAKPLILAMLKKSGLVKGNILTVKIGNIYIDD